MVQHLKCSQLPFSTIRRENSLKDCIRLAEDIRDWWNILLFNKNKVKMHYRMEELYFMQTFIIIKIIQIIAEKLVFKFCLYYIIIYLCIIKTICISRLFNDGLPLVRN